MTTKEAEACGYTGKKAERYAKWRTRLDKEVHKICRMYTDDLPDWDFSGAFEDGLTPKEAAYALMQYTRYLSYQEQGGE